VHITREQVTAKLKYLPLLLILCIHHFLRFYNARSLSKSFESAVGGNGGINDTFWYLGIAHHGYNFAPAGANAHQSAWAFYPLWPNLVAVGRHIGIPAVWWGLILVTVVAFLAAIQLSRLVSMHFSSRVGYICAILFVGQLYALSLISIMTESLFALIAFTALIAWQKRQYNQVGLLIILACLTKSFGLALALTFFIAILIKIRKSELNLNQVLFPFLACVFSPLIWISLVALHFQNVRAYFDIQRQGWGNEFNVGGAFTRFIFESIINLQESTSWELIVVLVACLTLGLVTWAMVFPVPIEWKIFILATAYMSIAHRSWHIADARFMTSIGLCLFPIAVSLEKFRPILRNTFLVCWLIPGFYLSSIALSGF